MRYDEAEHPDRLEDEKKFSGTSRGGNQAVEDLAIRAYIAAYEAGNIHQAERLFFEIHHDAAKRIGK